MATLQDLVAKATQEIQADINRAAENTVATAMAFAKNPSVSVPKAPVNAASFKGLSTDAQRLGDVAYIVNKARGGQLTQTEVSEFDARFKAIGVTTDIASLLPSGFTGALLHDIQKRLVVTNLFPYKSTAAGQYDSIATYGITGYLIAEATAGTESSESYINMIYLVEKCMAVVKKSYEALDDSLIDLASEVRMGIIDALARAIENAIINGDNTATHMDDATNAGIVAKDYRKAFKGLRKLGLGKATVDFGGSALTEADWLKYISAMQDAGGVYLDNQEASRGNVVLVVNGNVYNQLRMLPSFLTKEKAGNMATLFGAPVDTIFGMPVIMTPYLPKVNAAGVVDATAGNNTKGTIVMVNKETCRYYSTGSTLLETDRDIYTQFIGFTGSIQVGFNSIFDRLASSPDSIDATRKNIVIGRNINLI